ncbi:MAG: sensor domain-containing protein [Actinobacteria bacterium]|nr:sensor domain-containing protein [Actinomycetota bacterium]
MSAAAAPVGAEDRGLGARAADVAARAGLDLAYLTIGLATSIVAFVVWVTALSVTISLLVFIVGLPLFLLSAIAFRWTAELDRRNAALALGRPLRGRYRDHRDESFLARLRSTAEDHQTWRDLGWLVAHSVLGFGSGLVAVILVAQTIATAALPLWFWAIEGGVDFGVWHVDTLGKALATALLAIPLAAITVGLLRLMTIAESWLAKALLEGGGAAAPAAAQAATAEPAAEPGRSGRRLPDGEAAVLANAAISGFLALLVTAVWAATGAGYFWPAWVYLGLLIPLGLNAGLREAWRVEPGRRALAVQAVISLLLVGVAIAVWALAGFGTFWPIWVLLGVVSAFALHFLAALMWHRVFPDQRERELTERVETLTRTRRGALDVQSAELRRIERDLHDGAQARLVSLSMQLGRAEERLAGEPEAAALLRAARHEASAAIAEMRDLARGIAPPVLADRGLGAAVESLGRRAAIPVAVSVELDERPPVVIETAAYFVVAEALTNVAKHAPEAEAAVAVARAGGVLVIEVTDNGPGGADPEGGGLAGLRGRVEALDGRLRVSSPAGAGTTIVAELPCES